LAPVGGVDQAANASRIDLLHVAKIDPKVLHSAVDRTVDLGLERVAGVHVNPAGTRDHLTAISAASLDYEPPTKPSCHVLSTRYPSSPSR
jgi:hypothetical protein